MAGMFTDEQLQILMGMGDLSEQEKEMQRQMAEADLLRQSGGALGTRRMDWASQANRALQGTLGGMRDAEARRKQEELSKQRREVLRGLFGKKDPNDMSGWGYL